MGWLGTPHDRAYHGNGISAGFSKDSAIKIKHIEIHRNLSAFCFQWSYLGPNFQTSVSSCTNTRSPCKIQICTLRFLHMRAVPILAEMWHSENRCCKILAHILWEQQWNQSCWKHSSHFYFSLLCRPFILFPLALEVFPMLFSVSGKSAHLLHANHTSFSNLFFKLLLIPFMLILLLSFSFQLKSELPLTGSFKCVYLFIALCVS